MKKSILMLMIIGALSLGLIGFSTDSFAQRGGYGMHHGMRGWGSDYGPQSEYGPRGEDWNYCPYCGRNFHGRGGYGMDRGMMGPGHGYGYGRAYDWGERGPQEPLDEKAARQRVEEFLDSSRNPNLKIGGIEDKGSNFVAEVVTKDGSLVDKLVINKDSGWIRSMY